MKIAFILPSLANKGPIIVVKTLVPYLLKNGYDVDIYYFDDIYGANFDCPTFKINKNDQIHFDEYDIIHSHVYRPDKYLYKWRKYIKKAKKISTIHAHIEKDLTYTYNKLISIIFSYIWIHRLKYFDSIVSISKLLENIYKKRLPNISTIHNGVSINPQIGNTDADVVRKIVLKKEEGYKIIGTYAYITRSKGIHQVVKQLVKKKDYVFVAIGDGPEVDNLIKLSKQLAVIDRVLFFPYQPEPYNYLPLFDLYAMPSYSEGFGLALVEAAQAKCSIICSDIPIFKELFNDTQVTFFKPDDPISLSNAITDAYELRNTKGELANIRAQDNFSALAMSQGYIQLYERLVST